MTEEGAPRPSELAVCVDFGSTFTKALLVDLAEGRLCARSEQPTTLPAPDGSGDLMDGYDACLAALAETDPRAGDAPVLACSSAGGGLRIAVVGNEELVTAEAGRRVALSSGGRVVQVLAHADGAEDSAYRALSRSTRPDVVLLTGGTDGGNAGPVVAAARAMVASGWRGPVVFAGNREAADDVGEALGAAGLPHVLTDNVVPRIGELAPDGARAAIREMFVAHVIGGKGLSRRTDLATLVRGATPDVVLVGVEVLASLVGDVAVVDVGGATTDVHSVLRTDHSDRDTAAAGPPLSRDVVAPTPAARTVEGDLGMRWSAADTVAAAELPGLLEAAQRRAADPGFVPVTEADRDDDERIAAAAAGTALRRHAGRSRVVLGPDGRVVERDGRDLREVTLLVASGGVLRHGRPGVAERVLAGSVGTDVGGGWQLPEHPRVVVDDDYLLVAVGLLAPEHPRAALRLAGSLTETGA